MALHVSLHHHPYIAVKRAKKFLFVAPTGALVVNDINNPSKDHIFQYLDSNVTDILSSQGEYLMQLSVKYEFLSLGQWDRSLAPGTYADLLSINQSIRGDSWRVLYVGY